MILPEQAPSRVRGGFRAFYSDEGGHPGIVAVVKARFPAPTAFLIPFTLAKARSDFEERVYLGPKRKTKPRGTRVRTVAKTTLHDLRHTFGTSAARHGIPLRTIMEWMGHEDIKTTMILVAVWSKLIFLGLLIGLGYLAIGVYCIYKAPILLIPLGLVLVLIYIVYRRDLPPEERTHHRFRELLKNPPFDNEWGNFG